MDKVEDGGPAFPHRGDIQLGIMPTSGMSLRDYFAGQALSNIAQLGNYSDGDLSRKQPQHDAERIAASAYRIADAMLLARKAGDQS